MPMASTQLDLSILEDLDFQPPCEAVFYSRFFGHLSSPCGKPAEWSATVHQVFNCQWVDKFYCSACIQLIKQDACYCGVENRVRNLTPIRGKGKQ